MFNLSFRIPSKHAWKSIKTTIQKKFKTPIKKLTHTLITLPPIRPLISRKPPSVSTQHHLRKPIYVDELFPGNRQKKEIPKMKLKIEQEHSIMQKSCIKACESSSRGTNLEVSKKVRGIDERAEEFICKFKEDMKIEREQSLVDFQEMLARSI